jgi:hypothetical protein
VLALFEKPLKEEHVEKQLATASYWIGIVSTFLAVVGRLLAAVGVFVPTATPEKFPISYRSFLDGAILFFMMAIASSLMAWAKEQKA